MANTTSESPQPALVHGGSVFTQDLIEGMTDESSPLNLDNIRKPIYMDPSTKTNPMQPQVPTHEQTHAYNEYCRSLAEISEDIAKQTRYLKYTPWRKDLVDDSNRKAGHRFKEMYVDAIEDSDLRDVASLFLHTCSPPWAAGHCPSTYRLIKGVAEGQTVPHGDVRDPAAVMAFRWELAQLADHLVQSAGLPRPNGDPCLLWDFDLREYANDEGFRTRWGTIYKHLRLANFEPRPTPAQGRPYHQFTWYLAFALAAAGYTEARTFAIMGVWREFMSRARHMHVMKVLLVARYRPEGHRWMMSIHRQASCHMIFWK